MPVVVLTGSGTWSLPSDWSDANNTIEIYAAGGNGANGTSSTSGGGGGGGGYIKATNAPLAAAIAAGVVNNLGYGTVGANTIFGNVTTGYDDETLNPHTATFLAASWGSNASGITGGSGGNGTRNNPYGFTVAALNRAGGLGGNGRSSTTAAGGGGGGAAGPNGNGANGGANSTTSGTVGRGGGGANGGTAGSGTSATAGVGANGGGSGGTGGTASSGSAGSAGTTVYSGGGGGGAADGNAAYVGGAGGGYGGGGGGAGATTGSTGGAGAPAIIVITYIPAGQNTLQATEVGSDTAAISGKVRVQGQFGLTENSGDTIYIASGARGNLIATEARDTASVVGKVIVDGGLAATEGADTAYFSRAKRVVLIPTIGGSTSFTLPGDWKDAGSVIEVYGRGGRGSDYVVLSSSGGGGGGGGYLRITSATYTLKSFLGDGRLATLNYSDTGNAAGGGYTVFGTHAFGSGIVVQNGSASSGLTAGSAGLSGASYASFGDIEGATYLTPEAVFSGGAGGNGRSSPSAGGGGGGGAAGSNGNGGAGAANITATGSNGGSGGTAGGGFAGAGGAGGNNVLKTNGLAGENYGGGGGGAPYLTGALGGAGGSGAIILTYFPTNYMATGEASGDTLSASGSVTGVGEAGVTGDLAATEQGADTASASGKVPVKGSLSATEARDTAALTGRVSTGGAVSGSLSATEARDSFFGLSERVTNVPLSAEIQKLTPSAVIELFEIDARVFGFDLLRFHAGTNALQQRVVWQGNAYEPFPIQVEGFELNGNGQVPRPRLRVANVTGTITAMVLAYQDMVGAKIARKRTLAKYLDAVNFPGGVNPTADASAEFADDIYYIDRKSRETRDVVEFELAASFDLEGVTLPRRQIVQNVCPWKYRGSECGYTGASYFDANDQAVGSSAQDVCGKRLSSCQARFGQHAELPFGGFPAAGLIR